MNPLAVAAILKNVVGSLALVWDVDDECWNLIEKDALPPNGVSGDQDAILAKFYDGDEEATGVGYLALKAFVDWRAAHGGRSSG